MSYISSRITRKPEVNPGSTDCVATASGTLLAHPQFAICGGPMCLTENLEDSVITLRWNPLVGNHLNNSVYFYWVASDVCSYVVEKDGKPVRMTQVSNDCCEYGLVAVDRITSKSYWFHGEQRADTFKEFVQDEQIHPDRSEPTLFISFYRELVWGESSANEIRDLGQLRDAVQQNFQSAYSPYERDNAWQRKFDRWWRNFLSHNSELKLDTTFARKSDGITVRGYAFKGSV